jgi:hypothetical protein
MSRADCRSLQPHFPSAHHSHAAVAANEVRRRQKHGPIRPMQEPGLLERLRRRLKGR